eukprot:5856426-Amphidinium_carterae.1
MFDTQCLPHVRASMHKSVHGAQPLSVPSVGRTCCTTSVRCMSDSLDSLCSRLPLHNLLELPSAPFESDVRSSSLRNTPVVFQVSNLRALTTTSKGVPISCGCPCFPKCGTPRMCSAHFGVKPAGCQQVRPTTSRVHGTVVC